MRGILVHDGLPPDRASPERATKLFGMKILPVSPTRSRFCADFRLAPLMFSIFYEAWGRGRGTQNGDISEFSSAIRLVGSASRNQVEVEVLRSVAAEMGHMATLRPILHFGLRPCGSDDDVVSRRNFIALVAGNLVIAVEAESVLYAARDI